MVVYLCLCPTSGVSETFSTLCVHDTEVKLRETRRIIVHPWFKLLLAHFSSHRAEVSYGLNHSQQAACTIPLLLPRGDICNAHR